MSNKTGIPVVFPACTPEVSRHHRFLSFYLPSRSQVTSDHISNQLVRIDFYIWRHSVYKSANCGAMGLSKKVTTILSPRLMRTSINQCETTFIQEYGCSSIDANSALIILVSINSTSPDLLYHFFNCSIDWVFTAGAKTAIAGPEPLIPAGSCAIHESVIGQFPTNGVV